MQLLQDSLLLQYSTKHFEIKEFCAVLFLSVMLSTSDGCWPFSKLDTLVMQTAAAAALQSIEEAIEK